ncbi:MAG: phosphoenolpyruvate--protein phosphotransferase [Pseudomonadota bacterium]
MVSFSLHGVGGAGGIAIGRAHKVSHVVNEVVHYTVSAPQIAAEIARYKTALKRVSEELETLRKQAENMQAPGELAAILEVHSLMLQDSSVAEQPCELIEQHACNAEWAVSLQMQALVEKFEVMEDPYLRERKADVLHVCEHLLKALVGEAREKLAIPSISSEKTILVAYDLSPADVLHFKSNAYAAFLTDMGGVNSHTAIVARSMGIPAIVALHNARRLIQEGDSLIVDGAAQVVIVNPDREVLAEYRLRQSALELDRQKLKRLRTAPCASLDGISISMLTNVELPQDAVEVIESGADGVGLFRSEFLFLNRPDWPSEEEQLESYISLLNGVKGKPVTIRTFDLGADKQKEGWSKHTRVAPNPALGLRAVRFSLAEPLVFLTQLRAILRASAYGPVQILIPMISHINELHQVMQLIERAKQQLTKREMPFADKVPLGGMIEVPAAAMLTHVFAKYLDFLSIGTNDLIQYTLAIDRTDEAVSYLYDPMHPAIVRLLTQTIRQSTKAGVPISVCGEMAGDINMTRLFLGMGLRSFSMQPAQILPVKQRILTSEVKEAQEWVNRLNRTDDPAKFAMYAERLNA